MKKAYIVIVLFILLFVAGWFVMGSYINKSFDAKEKVTRQQPYNTSQPLS